MNVDPVPTSLAGTERQTPEKRTPTMPTQHSSGSGNSPKAEIAKTQNSPAPFLILEHEVKVQWDAPADHIGSRRPLDKQSGALVLQV